MVNWSLKYNYDFKNELPYIKYPYGDVDCISETKLCS